MTASKTTRLADAVNLSIRARSGHLTAEEQRAFEQALHSDASLRVAHQFGRDFDAALRVRPGDDELIQLAASRALPARTHRGGRRRSVLTLGLAATVLVASAAAALALWRSAPSSERAAVRAPAPAPASRAGKAAQAALAGTAAWRGESEREPSASSSPGRGSESSAALAARGAAAPTSSARAAQAKASRREETLSAAPADVTSPEPQTAASWFRVATAARHDGDLARARALYAQLQSLFPDSNEARVSRVSLGKLLLAAGRAREAELQFGAYLASGGGALEEEALVGRADSLAQMGGALEERRVWEQLLRRHGSSVYADRARQRLRTLGGAAAP